MSFHDILRSRGLPETFYKLNTIQGPSRGVNRLEYDFLYLGWLYLYYCLNISFSDLEFHQRATIINKVFETNSSFYVKLRSTGKVQLMFFRSFMLVLAEFSFLGGISAGR